MEAGRNRESETLSKNIREKRVSFPHNQVATSPEIVLAIYKQGAYGFDDNDVSFLRGLMELTPLSGIVEVMMINLSFIETVPDKLSDFHRQGALTIDEKRVLDRCEKAIDGAAERGYLASVSTAPSLNYARLPLLRFDDV